MSLEDFWGNVRSGCLRFSSSFDLDRPSLKREEILDKLRENDFWFRKQSVAGFNKGDFEFLDGATQTELSERVDEFKKLVPNAPTKTPATEADKEKAMGVFADIIETLEFGRFGNAEGLRLGKLIEKELDPCPPEGVAELRFEAGSDHSGDPAVWIWVFVDRENSKTDDLFLAKTQEVREIIGPIARRIGGERWPYYRMLSIEDAELSETVDVKLPTSEAHP